MNGYWFDKDLLDGQMEDGRTLTDQCTCCHKPTVLDNLTKTHDGSDVCKTCLAEYYDTCIWCNSIIDLDDISLSGECPVCGNEV